MNGIPRALTHELTELGVVGNEGSNPQPESTTNVQNSHVCLVLKPLMRNSIVS